jgi:hypothetical protein
MVFLNYLKEVGFMQGFKVILTKVESNHNNLRTNEIDGLTLSLPEKGKFFQMVAPPLESGSIRSVTTTEIKELEKTSEDSYTFKTQNSTYKLKVYGTEEIE